MRISGILSHLNVDQIKKADASKKAGTAAAKKVEKDASIISSDGKRLSETAADINTVRAQTDAQPEIRVEKVEEVKEKIKNGFYNSEAFIDQLAEKIMKDFGI